MADFHDAELILKLYELRTDSVMREARKFIVGYKPASFEEIVALQRDLGSPQRSYWRQVVTYWDMAAALVMHDALDAGLFVDANTEPFYLYAKFAPYREQWNKTFGEPFMKQIGLMIETHLPAKEKYEMYMRRLNPDKK
jgi:hypothetical protein